MELEVFSDPQWGVLEGAPVPHDRLSDLASYDEQMVKPALLLADRVTLRSWRLDLQNGVRINAAASQLGAPLMGNIKWFAYGDSEEARQVLGIDDRLLGSLRRTVDVFNTDPIGYLGDSEFLTSEPIEAFVDLFTAFHRQQYDALSGERLSALVERGLLAQRPWDDRRLGRLSYPDHVREHEEEAFSYGWQQMGDALSEGHAGIVLDRGVDALLHDSGSQAVQASSITLENATNLLSIVGGLSRASLDEVVDIREELREYLDPFRSFLLSHARGVHVTADMPLAERRRQAELTWQADVAPAIAELRGMVESEGFARNAVRVAAQGPESIIGVGLGLTTAMASGAIGVTALAGLGVAALPTIIKAAASSLQARKANRRNGAYFVLEVERRLGGARPS